jgi:uncharacterized membrane protein
MTPATHDTLQAHLDDLPHQAARHRHAAPSPTTRSRTSLTFTNTIQITRPAHEVFGFLEDFTHMPLWNYWVRHVAQDTDGPVRVGTVFHQIRLDDQQSYRLVEQDPPRRLTVTTLDGHRPAFTRSITLEPVAGGTHITDHWELDTGHPALLQRLAAGRIRDGIITNLTKLKELLETGRTVLPDGRVTTTNPI